MKRLLLFIVLKEIFEKKMTILTTDQLINQLSKLLIILDNAGWNLTPVIESIDGLSTPYLKGKVCDWIIFDILNYEPTYHLTKVGLKYIEKQTEHIYKDETYKNFIKLTRDTIDKLSKDEWNNAAKKWDEVKELANESLLEREYKLEKQLLEVGVSQQVKRRLNSHLLKKYNQYNFSVLKGDRIGLIGSTFFKSNFMEIESILQIKYKKLVSIGSFDGLLNKSLFSYDEWEELQAICIRKLKFQDAILVLDVNNYIGDHTTEEINYCTKTFKIPVYYLSKLIKIKKDCKNETNK